MKPRPTKAERQRKEAARAERATTRAHEDKRRSLAAAGVEWDPRTAQGKRNFDVVGLGASTRASVNHLNHCLGRKADRTNSRILAWAKFDEHMHRVKAGEIASPKLEPGVDRSTTPGVAESRLDALRADAALQGRLGADYHRILTAVIFRQETFMALAAGNRHEAEAVSYVFRRALDTAAWYWGIGPEPEFGTVMDGIVRAGRERRRADEEGRIVAWRAET